MAAREEGREEERGEAMVVAVKGEGAMGAVEKVVAMEAARVAAVASASTQTHASPVSDSARLRRTAQPPAASASSCATLGAQSAPSFCS